MRPTSVALAYPLDPAKRRRCREPVSQRGTACRALMDLDATGAWGKHPGSGGLSSAARCPRFTVCSTAVADTRRRRMATMVSLAVARGRLWSTSRGSSPDHSFTRARAPRCIYSTHELSERLHRASDKDSERRSRTVRSASRCGRLSDSHWTCTFEVHLPTEAARVWYVW